MGRKKKGQAVEHPQGPGRPLESPIIYAACAGLSTAAAWVPRRAEALNRPLIGTRLARARSGGVELPVSAPAHTAGVRALASPPSGIGDVGEMDTGYTSVGKSTLHQKWGREKARPQVALGEQTGYTKDHTTTVYGTLWPL